jgi:hypothetical protein
MIKKMNDPKDKEVINKMLETIWNYYKKYEKLKNIFENSELNKTLEKNENENSLLNEVYKSEEFIDNLKYNGSNSRFIVWILRWKLGDLWEWENVTKNYRLLYDNLEWNTEEKEKAFKNILEKLNKVISAELVKKKGKIENTKIDTNILEQIENKKLLNNLNINLDWAENEFDIYLLNLEKKLKKDWKKLNKNNFDLYLNDFIKINNLSKLPDNFQKKIKEYIINKNNFDFSKKIEKDKDFIKAVKEWTLKEFIKEKENDYFSNLESDIKKYDEQLKLQNNIKNINNRPIVDKNYNITDLPEKITDDNSIIVNWNKIENITKDEYNSFEIKNWQVWNPEALKNLVNMREKLDKLWLEFVWNNRASIIKVMNNDSEFKMSWVNATDSNLMDKREFNILLQFILKINWEENPSTIESENYAKILRINQIWAISDKKEFHSWLSNIGTNFIKIWYFNSNWNIDIFWEDKLRQFVKNWYKTNI